MQEYGFATTVRSLRTVELRLQRDYTPQALQLLYSRLDTIKAMKATPEQKQMLTERAMKQWETFMQRPVPANG